MAKRSPSSLRKLFPVSDVLAASSWGPQGVALSIAALGRASNSVSTGLALEGRLLESFLLPVLSASVLPLPFPALNLKADLLPGGPYGLL